MRGASRSDVSLWILLLFWCLPACAQDLPESATGTLAGTVIDPQEAPIPGVAVMAVDDVSGEQYETMTDCGGHYRLSRLPVASYRVQFAAKCFSNLPAGNYCLTAEAPNFRLQTVPAVQMGQTTNVRLQVLKREVVQVCSGSCPVRTLEYIHPTHPSIALQLRAETNVVSAGSPVWLDVTLKNLSPHPISIRAAANSDPPFGYEIYAENHCNCPGKLRRGNFGMDPVTGQDLGAKDSSIIKVPPGGELTDRFDLSKLGNISLPDNYWIKVLRQDVSSAGEEIPGQLVVESSRIVVRVIPASLAENCK